MKTVTFKIYMYTDKKRYMYLAVVFMCVLCVCCLQVYLKLTNLFAAESVSGEENSSVIGTISQRKNRRRVMSLLF